MSPKRAPKPAKPQISVCHVLIACAVAGVFTSFTLVAAVADEYGRWPDAAYELAELFATLAWIGTFALLATRHITRYIHRCERAKERRLDAIETSLRRTSIVDEAELFLRSGET